MSDEGTVYDMLHDPLYEVRVYYGGDSRTYVVMSEPVDWNLKIAQALERLGRPCA
jgi:hypothetical protein